MDIKWYKNVIVLILFNVLSGYNETSVCLLWQKGPFYESFLAGAPGNLLCQLVEQVGVFSKRV